MTTRNGRGSELASRPQRETGSKASEAQGTSANPPGEIPTPPSAEWDSRAGYAAVYELLIVQRERTVTELTRRVPSGTQAQVHEALRQLQARGLAAPRDAEQTIWEALPPANFINQRLHHLEVQLADERGNFTGMLEEFWKARSRTITSYAEVEALRDVQHIERVYLDLLRTARQQVRGMVRAPYVVPVHGDTDFESMDLQLRRMAEGTDFRVLYETNIFTDPLVGADALKGIAAGEQARTIAVLPLKLIAADETQALVLFDELNNPNDAPALLIHRSGLLNALISVFESLWNASTPLAGRTTQVLDKVDRTILTLMVAGSTDEAIGLAVGMSRRTVARRCATLFARLGATNRFQAGAQAVRRGWL